MSKSNEWFIDEMERKFGGVYADEDTLCSVCERRKAEHSGAECPVSQRCENASEGCTKPHAICDICLNQPLPEYDLNGYFI